MFGFPIGNGNAGFNDFVEKFTNNADSGFPNIQQREVFYSVKDGIWNDTSVWQTASGRVGLLPTANDDVYIRNSITYSVIPTAISAYNLFITGTFNYGSTGSNINIFGNLKCTGTLNHLTGTINLYGSENYINNYVYSISEANITYARNDGIPQPIMPLTYNFVSMSGISPKFLTSDLVSTGTAITPVISSTFDTRGYNVTIESGIIFNTSIGDFIANGSTLIFKGLVTWFGIRRYEIINSILEFRGGWTWNPPIGTFANSVINFTTNTQNVQVNYSGSGAHIIDANSVNIVGNITLNIAAAGNDYLVLNCPINGSTASSQLTNRSLLQFGNTASVPSMSTGVFDFSTFANTINYGGNYSATIPSYFTTFHNLTISGTGTKTLGVNTTLNGNLNESGLFDTSTFTLFVSGTTTVQNSGTFTNSGGGNMTFVGLLSVGTGATYGFISFTGNPNIECRGGFLIEASGTNNAGTGTWTFTTNNQTLNNNNNTSTLIVFENIVVSGAITLSITNATKIVQVTSSINGTLSTSKVDNKGVLYLNSFTTPMSTGSIDVTTFANTIGYIANGNFTIPRTSYYSLFTSGTGTKSLSGNTTLAGNLSVGNGKFECLTYDLSVGGTTTIATQSLINSEFSKTGAGSLLFTGIFVLGSAAGGILTLSGNPTIEFRGGITTNAISGTPNFGTGTCTFTTNNQNITSNSNNSTNITLYNVIISGAITITNVSTIRQFVITNSINGDNINSKLLNSGTITYQGNATPMVTGVLDTSTNLNTWIYGLNNQDIKGGLTILTKQVYRNLTLNGTGVKTLQGYVSVLNTYTLTSPATLALNGYTLTNP